MTDINDGARDNVEDGAVAEMAAALVPGIGGALAALVNRSFGSAQLRRIRSRLTDLESALNDRSAIGVPLNFDEMAESEEFAAHVTLWFEESLRTADKNKQRALRNALVNGVVVGTASSTEGYLRAAARLDPEDLVVMNLLDEMTADAKRLQPGTVSRLRDEAQQRGLLLDPVATRLARLVA